MSSRAASSFVAPPPELLAYPPPLEQIAPSSALLSYLIAPCPSLHISLRPLVPELKAAADETRLSRLYLGVLAPLLEREY